MTDRLLSLLIPGALAVACACGPDASAHALVELPRPNSGAFSFEQAKHRRDEIFAMVPSGMRNDWQNPFMGFAVHIHRDEQLQVYCSGLRDFSSGSSDWRTARPVQLDELASVIKAHRTLTWGNPIGVLVTAANGGESSVLPGLVEQLFDPSVQVYYLRERG